MLKDKPLYLMRRHRQTAGMGLEAVAKAVDTHSTQLYRIEMGESMPKHKTARALYELYDGQVPLAAIYDPEFAEPLMKKPRRRRG